MQYYFKLQLTTDALAHGLAMVSVYTPPDDALYAHSYETLWSCRHGGDATLRIIDIKTIQSVVAMIPHPHVADPTLNETLKGRVFVGEKMGLDIMNMAGIGDDAEAENDD